MARALSIIVATVLAVAAVAVPAVAVLLLFPSLWLPALVEQRLGAELHRAVEVAGPASLDLFDGPPTIVVRDLRIANPPWADEPWFLRASRVRVDLSWEGLRRFEADPIFLSLDQPRAVLVRTRSGGVTWLRNGTGDGFDLNRLRINDGRVLFRDEEAATEVIAEVSSQADRLAVDAEGVWEGLPVSASMVGGGVRDLLGGARDGYPLRGELRTPDLHLAAEGIVVGLPGLRGLDVELAGKGSSLARVGALFGMGLPDSPPFVLKGHLRSEGQVWEYSDVSGTIGNSDVAGRVALHGGPDTLVEAEVSSSRLHLSDALALAGYDLNAEANGNDRVIPDVPLPGEGLQGMRLNIALTAKETLGGPLPLGALRTQIRAGGGRVQLAPLEFTLPNGGSVDARLIREVGAPPSRLDAEATVRQARFLVPMAEGEHAEGVVGGQFSLTGHGDSLTDVLGTASGEGSVLVSSAYLSQDVLGQVGIGLDDVLGLFLPANGEGTMVHCAAATFSVSDGVAQVPALIVDADTGRVEGAGRLDLGRELMDLTVTVDPADPQLLAYSGDVGVSGPWTDPQVDPEMGEMAVRGAAAAGLGFAIGPLAALVPFMDLGLGEDSGCHQALPPNPSTSEAP